ncbi:Ig-like domain-containing protein [Clostridium sp. C8-1-8]|uniref:Ig-like domain-containing protein n=1 Tax=Clostridium sp. C8-1-8 TaxID=2698831 RepID=UPI001367ADB5|nr:Ig-like domain-containing protein [Clostridium sp. C8-1-8]
MNFLKNRMIRKVLSFTVCIYVFFMYSTPVYALSSTQSGQNEAASSTKPMLMCIDSPTSNSQLSPYTLVTGWALNPAALREVRVYVDDNFNGNAYIGNYRPDVNSAYPGYPSGDRSGYSLTLDTAKLSNGNHTITVEQIGLDNSQKSTSVTVQKTQKDPITYIDYPTQNINLSKNILVTGWALNGSGMKSVGVYLDDMFKGYATLGDMRPDVAAAYPGYPNGDRSGYKYTVDTANLSPGSHTIKVVGNGADGTSKANTVSFNYYIRSAMYQIDEPSNGSNITSDFAIRGWALSPSGVKSVELSIDGNYVGQGTIGLMRPDVNKVYPDYDNSLKSGYQCSVGFDTIKPGNHLIQIRFNNNDQSSETRQFNINIVKPEPKANIDSPAPNSTILSDQVLIGGWGVNAAGVAQVKVYIDGVYVGDAAIGYRRDDVGSAYSNYKESSNSGFNYVLSTNGMSVGKHDIKISICGKDGSILDKFTSFYLKGIVTYKQYDNTFDYYVNQQIQKGGNTYWDNTPATNEDVRYYMDVNNFLNNDTYRYMFLKLNYAEGISVDNLNNAVKGQGILDGKGQAFLDGGKRYNINPIYLVSHSLHETNNGLSRLANGILVTSVDGQTVEPRIVYNMYGIGAKNSDPERLGSEYAYKQGWFTVDSAIIGGASFISTDYITSLKYQQNTLYKMKWNYQDVYHEYATDVNWAKAQTTNIKKLIDKMSNPTLYFEVPAYK